MTVRATEPGGSASSGAGGASQALGVDRLRGVTAARRSTPSDADAP